MATVTPLQMKLLITAYSLAGRTFESECPSPTHKEQASELVDMGLISIGPELKITPKGKAWVERALATPLPVQAWVFPEVQTGKGGWEDGD